MSYKTQSSLTSIFILLLASLQVKADHDYDYSYENDYQYRQKLILVEGKKSSVMNGEKTPAFNFNKKKALPYYLNRGWQIQSVTIHHGSSPHNMHGYVVIEKDFR